MTSRHTDPAPVGDLSVAGLAFRPFRGAADAAAIAALHAARVERDGVDPLSTCERVPTAEEVMRSLPPRFEPERNALVAEGHGRVVGYVSIEWWVEAAVVPRGGTRVYLHLGCVIPDWRGRGVGTALLRWAERRIRELAAAHGQVSAGGGGTAGLLGGTAVFAANASTTERESTALLVAEGYRESFRVVELGMDDLARLPQPAAPDGFALRPATPEHRRAVWEAIHEAYAGGEHIGQADEEDYVRFARAAAPERWSVAWCGNEVAGVAICAVERGRAEVRELSVRPPFRRRGLGRYLLISALRFARERGVRHARLHTDANNPHRAYELYESAGFRRLKEHVRYRKPLEA